MGGVVWRTSAGRRGGEDGDGDLDGDGDGNGNRDVGVEWESVSETRRQVGEKQRGGRGFE